MKKFLFFLCLGALSSCAITKEEQVSAHTNLTLEEKVGQTCQITLDAVAQTDAQGRTLVPLKLDTNKLSEALVKYKVGSILNVSWHTLTREQWQEITQTIHAYYTSGRIKVPVLYGIDAIHGVNYTQGATLFPQEIGLAATWNPSLAAEFGRITAYETRASGIPWNFSPVLDLGRNPLWSRTFETLGEDPYLVSEMGAAIIKGYQGTNPRIIDSLHVLSCMKHFVGYSAAASGRDRTPAWIPDKYMKELYLPSFKSAVKAGAQTVMINSGTVNGIPGHVNKSLIQHTLKDEWKFPGFAVSDWEDFNMLHTVHRVAPNLKTAYEQAFNAGVDMSMVPLSPDYKTYCELMLQSVNEKNITVDRLNDAVNRIYRTKGAVGLFDKQQPRLSSYTAFGSPEHKAAAKQAALESITLLKNDGILPLKANTKFLVAGPCADNLVYLNGAWSHTWQGMDTSFNTKGCKTIVQAFQEKYGTQCLFSKGLELYKDKEVEQSRFVSLEDYIQKLDEVETVILCLGELPGTEKPGDIRSLHLDSKQLELAKMAYAKHKKVIIVLVEGRPRIIRDIVEPAGAIVQCYLPGDYGAEALVELLSGEKNFSGKLPYTYPKYDGVIEFYDRPRSVDRSNVGDFAAFNPEWPFGYGLHYGEVRYEQVKSTEAINNNAPWEITVDVINQGNREIDEVVQLYVGDEFASVVPAGEQLKRFQKVKIPAGQTVKVRFVLNKEDLMFVNEAGDWVFEPGTFNYSIGTQTGSVLFR
ncbi:MAG: glycoside hydrolase family 3 C-terminal domain-containing protein [Crocinitomicaceae bacterium]|nr:glycoside hydrolase family 3 C-terminal domain-containing protein [Crocinitomicaceae bacterium]